MKVRRLAITLLLGGVATLVPATPAPAHAEVAAPSQLLVTTPPPTTSPTESTQDHRNGMNETDGGVPVLVWILISAAVLVAGAFVAARLSAPHDL